MYSDKPKLHDRQKNYRKGSLRTLSLDVTSRCNMNCPRCYASTFRDAEPVGLDILRRAFDEAYELGVFHYVLQGGEPITNMPRLESILQMCHPEETYINVVSNGWAMTIDRIRKLKRLKVDKIAYSLDSGIAGEHDLNRGRGSYKRVLKAIDDTLSESLLTSISTVVTHSSLYSESFMSTYRYALGKNIRLDAQIVEPVGELDGQLVDLMTEADSGFLKLLQKSCPVLPNGQKMINRDIYSEDRDHCPAGTEFMAISADGQILPCNFLQFSLGNIKDKTIEEARKDLLASKWFDGEHSSCLIGENRDFIREFVSPYVGVVKPLDAYKVFGLAKTGGK